MALPASAQKYPLSSTGSFTPTSIGGCALWLDGADPAGTGTPPSNGATVSTWTDKSTSAKNATAGGTPTYVSGGGINFNGSSYFTNLSFAQNLSQRSIFIVMQETTRTAVGGVFPLIPNPSSGSDYDSTGTALSIETQNGLRFYSGAGYTSDIGNTSLLVKAVYNDNMNVRAGTGFVNGTSAATVTASYTAGTCSGYGLGARWIGGAISLTYPLNGIIFEILFFNTPLGITNRQLIEGYLAWKWGLQASLPPGHPYKAAAPIGSTTSRYSATKGRAPTVFPLTTSLLAKVTKAGFNAQQIAGLQLWLDASDASTFTFTSGKISQWLDKSSNAFTATQANATYQPSIQAADLNKKNTVNFSLDYMEITQGSAVYPHDCYCVIALKDTTTNVDFIGSSAHFTDNFNSLTFSDYTTSRWENGSSSSARTPNTVSATNETSTGYLLMRWSIADGNYQLWRNGTLLSQASYTYTQTSGSFFLLGQRSTQYLTNLLQGYIAEIQIYTTQLPTGQQQIVEGNLAWKWGLQGSLPLTHPYSKFPPLPYVAPPSPAVIVTTNLVENLDAATYTSGSTWTALVGNNYAVSGTLTTTSTPGGSTAVVLDGSSYAQDSTGITATTLYNYTLDVWFYSAAGQTASILGEGGQGNLGGWNVTVISIDSDTVSVGFWIGGVYQLSVGSYTANTWTHVAYSYNNTTGAVVGYLNGQLTATGTATKQWPATIFYTTGGGMNPYGNFTGQLGAYKVYNAILTDTQVNQNFNALRGRFGV